MIELSPWHVDDQLGQLDAWRPPRDAEQDPFPLDRRVIHYHELGVIRMRLATLSIPIFLTLTPAWGDENCFKLSDQNQYRECLERNNNAFVSPKDFDITSATAFSTSIPGSNRYFSYKVDPSHPDDDPIDVSNFHPAPSIAISAVTPPSNMCMEKVCWPAVFFFVDNHDPKLALKINVECLAIDATKKVLSDSESWVGLEPDQAGMSIIVFKGADYSKFRQVDCHITGFTGL